MSTEPSVAIFGWENQRLVEHRSSTSYIYDSYTDILETHSVAIQVDCDDPDLIIYILRVMWTYDAGYYSSPQSYKIPADVPFRFE